MQFASASAVREAMALDRVDFTQWAPSKTAAEEQAAGERKRAKRHRRAMRKRAKGRRR